MASRRAFTLVEMLVATSIFLIGFTAVYSLFLRGVRDRAVAEGVAMANLAAASICAELRLRFAAENADATGGFPGANTYLGHGGMSGGASGSGEQFYRYRDQAGIWYRVEDCATLVSDPSTLRMVLLVVYLPVPEITDTLAADRLAKLLGQADYDKSELINRGLMQRYELVVNRAMVH